MDADINRILLGKSNFPDVNTRELAEQIDSRKRCEKKLPLWFQTEGIYYPPKISVEQSSSEITAKFKAGLAIGESLIDLTGGFGVDCFYFQKNGFLVTHCEINRELSEISGHNARILGDNGTLFYTGDGLDLLGKNQFYDTIYVDPSRRINTRKVFKLQDCEPNVPANLENLKKKSARIIIKTSPLLDIQAGINELGNVNQIYILSIKNDCKELLWIIDPGDPATDTEVICHTFNNQIEGEYRFRISEERNFVLSNFSDPLNVIYEPDVALMKSGSFKLISRDFNVLKLNQHSHLYTSDYVREGFPGRTFKVDQYWDYKTFSKIKNIHKANVISRNFPLNPQQIKQKHAVKDGGDWFLIFTTGSFGQLIVIQCRKV